MKKNLLFASLLLVASAAYAQEEPQLVRSASDPKVIFEQTFEPAAGAEKFDYETWSTTPVDSIKKVRFYNVIGPESTSDGNFNDGRYISDPVKWNVNNYVERDSSILMYNGVVATDDKGELANNAFRDDVYAIVKDGDGEEQRKRAEAFEAFGEDGGDFYFHYKTGDTVYTSVSDYGSYHSDKSVANYRRNLMVRGLDIDENSSYRLTLYVKTKKMGSTYPRFYADLMRGYFHSEKPFSMTPYAERKFSMSTFSWIDGWSAKSFAFGTKAESDEEGFELENDTWQKVTMMSYYINDSIAQKFVSIDGYWWSSDWTWNVIEGEDTLDYHYVIQPDKFFVRLSFASDATDFCVDNISLTKSYIGGAEFAGTGLRIDFGYETNLGELAQAAKDKNKIDAVELPGDYFIVWGKDKTDHTWYPIPIKSAEYHGDGYMYMWTKGFDVGGMIYPDEFENYDSVLVSFINPVEDKNLALYYNGDLYPMSEDTLWVKEGKYVPNFINEIARPNSRCMDGVYSMYELPPVLQEGITAELGSFQLPDTTRTMTFQISRLCEFDGDPDGELAQIQVMKGGVSEFWPAIAATDSTITFQRPAIYTTALAGDYQFNFIHLKGAQTAEANPYVESYSFGPAVVDAGVVGWYVFDKMATDAAAKMTIDIDGFSLEKCAVQVVKMAADGLRTRGLTFGILNQKTGVGEKPSATNCAKLIYTFNIQAAGNYDFEAQFARWGGSNRPLYMTLYQVGQSEAIEAAFKNEHSGNGERYNVGNKVEYVDTIKFTTAIAAAGQYQLVLSQPESPETSNGSAQRDGFILFTLGVKTSEAAVPSYISYPYMSQFDFDKNMLDKVIQFAEKDADNEAQYKGGAYEEGVRIFAKYAKFNSDQNETAPSVWNAVIDSLQKATTNINARVAVVDAFWKAYDQSVDSLGKVDALSTRTGVNYKGIATYSVAKSRVDDYKSFAASGATDDSIKALTTTFGNDLKSIADQISKIDAYLQQLAKTKAYVDAAERPAYAEYSSMKEYYEANCDFDYIAAPADTTVSKTTAMAEATKSYAAKVSTDNALLARNKQLASAAQSLGVNFGENTDAIEARLKEVADDDDLAEIYKTAIKIALYKATAPKDIDLQGFIKNFNLYATVTGVDDRSDKHIAGMQANVGNFKSRGANGENILKGWHGWNNAAVWLLPIDVEEDDVFPGWTVKAFEGGNNINTLTSESEGYQAFKDELQLFDAVLAMDWNGKASLNQKLNDLPVGLYKIGAEFNNGNNASKFETKSLIDGVADSLLTTSIPTGKATVMTDTIKAEDGVIDLTLTLQSGNNWSQADNFKLIYLGKDGKFNYADEITALEGELEAKLGTLTFVGGIEGVAEYEYWTLGGFRTLKPQNGQPVIAVDQFGNSQTMIFE